MNRISLVGTASALVAAASVLAPAQASAKGGVLAGTWTSTDTDGSSQVLEIRGSGEGSYSMSLEDDSATNACGGDPAMFTGKGTAEGNVLPMVGTLVCLPGGNVVRHRLVITFEYAPATDTLSDETGVTWHRA